MQLYLTPASLAFLSQLIIFLVLAIHLLLIPRKTRTTHLMIFLATICCVFLFQMVVLLSLLEYDPNYGVWHVTRDAIILVSFTFFLHATRQLITSSPRIRRILYATQLSVAALLLVYLLSVPLNHSLLIGGGLALLTGLLTAGWINESQRSYQLMLSETFWLVTITLLAIAAVRGWLLPTISDSWLLRSLMAIAFASIFIIFGLGATVFIGIGYKYLEDRKMRQLVYGFRLPLLFLLIAIAWVVIYDTLRLPVSISIFHSILAVLFAPIIMFLGIAYFNYAPQPVSFLGKINLTIATVALTLLGTVGLWTNRFVAQTYQPTSIVPNQQTIVWTPEIDGADVRYRYAVGSLQMEQDWGERRIFDGVNCQRLNVPFALFADQADTSWQPIFCPNGDLYTESFELNGQTFGNTAILPYWFIFDPEEIQVYLKMTEERLVATWQREGEHPFLAQLVVLADGRIHMSYGETDVPRDYANDIQNPWRRAGIVSDKEREVNVVDFNQQPQSLATGFSTFAASYKQARSHTHQALLPFAYLMVLFTVVLLVSIPVLLQNGLVVPLRTLLQGVRLVNKGVLETEVPVRFNDEIGFLTNSFNEMVASIRAGQEKLEEANLELDARVKARTLQLQERSVDLEAAMKSAESANQAKSRFLANMSHELRTPLNAILGYTQLFHRQPPTPRTLAIVEESGQHLLDLINDLLDLAKIEADTLSLNPDAVGLSNTLHSITEMMRPHATRKGLQLYTDFAPDLPASVIVDEKRLRQILLNLLSNAIKFTPRGDVHFKARVVENQVDWQCDRAHVATIGICIKDEGVGIPADELALIQTPFYRTEYAEKETEGTGLGLALTMQLLNLMGSELHIQSLEMHGTTATFALNLPVVPDTPVVKSHERTIVSVKDAIPHVLLVDDKWQNRAFLRDLLEPLGFLITEAENGEAALNRLQKLTPDLILTDLVMPRLDGFALVRHLRQQSAFANLPIIAISASVLERDESLAVDAFMLKPFKTDELLNHIESLLQIEWIYSESNAEPDTAWTLPPQEIIVKLRDFVRKGDASAAKRLAEGLSADFPTFTARLLSLLQTFRLRELTRWLNEQITEQ